jgi:hypothetical protein
LGTGHGGTALSKLLAEHSNLKRQVIKTVTDKMKRDTALVDSMGKVELMTWSIEDKELVAPYAVELRYTLRQLVEHRICYRRRNRRSM